MTYAERNVDRVLFAHPNLDIVLRIACFVYQYGVSCL